MALELAAVDYVGIAGVILIIYGWLHELREEFREKKIEVHVHFLVPSLIGGILVTAYSYLIGNSVFLFLSGIIAILVFVEFLYSLHLKGSAKRRKG